MPKPEGQQPDEQRRGGRPPEGQENPAGHMRGRDRPPEMTDEQWEAERQRVNRERFVAKHGREPGPDENIEDDDGENPTP